jgi:hypothetical protein
MTPVERTRFLSREFLIGFAINLIVLVGGGFYAFGRLEARTDSLEPGKVTELQQKVAVLESRQIDAARVTALEVQMKNLEGSLLRTQAALDRNFYDSRNQR